MFFLKKVEKKEVTSQEKGYQVNWEEAHWEVFWVMEVF